MRESDRRKHVQNNLKKYPNHPTLPKSTTNSSKITQNHPKSPPNPPKSRSITQKYYSQIPSNSPKYPNNPPKCSFPSSLLLRKLGIQSPIARLDRRAAHDFNGHVRCHHPQVSMRDPGKWKRGSKRSLFLVASTWGVTGGESQRGSCFVGGA